MKTRLIANCAISPLSVLRDMLEGAKMAAPALRISFMALWTAFKGKRFVISVLVLASVIYRRTVRISSRVFNCLEILIIQLALHPTKVAAENEFYYMDILDNYNNLNYCY